MHELLLESFIPIKPYGIILHSKSGVGKSRFIEELFQKDFIDCVKIKIEVHTKTREQLDSLSFVKKLFDAVVNEVEKNGKIPFYKRFSWDCFQMTLNTPIGGSISPGSMLSNNYDSQTLYMFRYLLNTLSKSSKKFIIDFENFQCIDEESFDFFIRLFKCNLYNRYIFEYTLPEDGSMTELIKLKNKLEKNLNCKLYELKRLDIQELEKLCNHLKIKLHTALKYYNSPDYEGNLFAVECLCNQENSSYSNLKSKKIIESIVITLNSDEILLLYILLFNADSIELEELIQILHGKSETKIKFTVAHLNQVLRNLEQKKLIRQSYNTIQIYHDTILKELEAPYTDVRAYNAYNLLKDYHISQLNISENNENSILKLLHLYTQFTDEDIINLFPFIKKLILQQRYPDAIAAKIDKLNHQLAYKSSNKYLVEEITLNIVNLLFMIGHWKAAIDNLNLVFDNTKPRHLVYKAALISCDIENPETESDLKEMLKTNKNNRLLTFSISSSLAAYYMRCKQSAFTNNFIADLLKSYSDISFTLEYALLLKNYSEYLNNLEAMKELEKCFQLFKKADREDFIVFSKITYASRLAYDGQLERAQSILEESRKDSEQKEIVSRQYYYFNNLAAMHILNNRLGCETEELLQNALFMVANEYERLIILSNLLIYYCMIKNRENAMDIADELIHSNYNQYSYEELVHIVLYNLYYYCHIFCLSDMAIQYRMQLESLSSCDGCSQELREYISSSLNNSELPRNHQWAFYSKLPYRPDFIGYWQMEIIDRYS